MAVGGSWFLPQDICKDQCCPGNLREHRRGVVGGVYAAVYRHPSETDESGTGSFAVATIAGQCVAATWATFGPKLQRNTFIRLSGEEDFNTEMMTLIWTYRLLRAAAVSVCRTWGFGHMKRTVFAFWMGTWRHQSVLSVRLKLRNKELGYFGIKIIQQRLICYYPTDFTTKTQRLLS